MKLSRKYLILLLTASALLGCSSDITVEDDVGMVATVKESSVTPYQFDKKAAKTFLEERLSRGKKELIDCYSNRYMTESICKRAHAADIDEKAKQLNAFSRMPGVTIVRYRFVTTDLNNKKTPSEYIYVACIPQSEPEKQAKWAELIHIIDGINGDPQKEIESNLIINNTVASQLNTKVCDKYGYRLKQ